MSGFIQITLATLTLKLRMFTSDTLPRLKLEPAEQQRSQLGTRVAYGRYFEDPHIWSIDAFITEPDLLILDAMYWESQKLRRSFADDKLLILDTTAPFQERSPRTRAKAASPFHIEKALGGGTHVSYYAQYYGYFTSRPEYRGAGMHRFVKVAIAEFDSKVIA